MSENNQDTMISVQGLSKYYGSFVAIEDITFSIPRGQVVAFLGPNGAGKTTTMKILTGFLSPSKGSVELAGFSVERERLQAAKRLGYLPENGPLYDDMTPSELLEFFGRARGLSDNYLKQRSEKVSAQCALEQVMEKPVGKLSRGYRQRVGLALALLHDPDVLIMDEPTAGLDPNQIREFRANIGELGKTKTILISTHILQEVEAIADRVIFIHNGKLLFDGNLDEMAEGKSLADTFYRMTGFGKNN